MSFTKVPNELLGLTSKRLIQASDIAVYVAIASHRNQRTGACFPSMRTIANELSVSRQTVFRAVRRMEAAGALITSTKNTQNGKQATRYTFPYLGSPSNTSATSPSNTSATPKYHQRDTQDVTPVVQELEDEVNKNKRGASARIEPDEPRALTEEDIIPIFSQVRHHHVWNGDVCIRCKEERA